MKIYVASSWRNLVQPNAVGILRRLGHEVYDFKNPGVDKHGFSWKEIDPTWELWQAPEFIWALRSPVAEEGFRQDREAMEWADTCVLLLPCGRSAHLEAGYMKGLGKKLFIVLEGPGQGPLVPELMYKLADHIFPGLYSMQNFFGLNHPERTP